MTGFVGCLILTSCSFLLVGKGLLTGWPLRGALAFLALVQAAVQFLFFLHLGREFKPRWNLLVFSFMALVLLILVFGSLWIMYNLDTRMMGRAL
jgi:cytochrome o ubiquinol oxidase operon protein cyoD